MITVVIQRAILGSNEVELLELPLSSQLMFLYNACTAGYLLSTIKGSVLMEMRRKRRRCY